MTDLKEMRGTEAQVPVVRCPTCQVPYVFRWSLNLRGDPPEYLMQRDCKHKFVAPTSTPLEDMETATFSLVFVEKDDG